MSETPLDVLKRARGILSDRDHWVQRHYEFFNAGSRSYCLIGAVEKATGIWSAVWEDAVVRSSDLGRMTRCILSDYLMQQTGSGNVEGWNDDPRRQHSEVLELLDKVIAREESRIR